MSLTGLLSQSATVLGFTPGAADEYGNAAESWVESGVWPARFEQTDGREVTDDRDTQVSDWRVFLPPDVEIGGRDRVVDEHGRTFEVVGPPARQSTPAGPHHVVANLRSVS